MVLDGTKACEAIDKLELVVRANTAFLCLSVWCPAVLCPAAPCSVFEKSTWKSTLDPCKPAIVANVLQTFHCQFWNWILRLFLLFAEQHFEVFTLHVDGDPAWLWGFWA